MEQNWEEELKMFDKTHPTIQEIADLCVEELNAYPGCMECWPYVMNLKDCDGCGHYLLTVVIGNLNLIPQALKIEREDEFGQRI